MAYERKTKRSAEMDAVIARIEEVRKQRGLHPSEFARRLGIPIQTYDNYTNRQASEPSVRLLFAVKREFGVSADWLLGAP